MPRMAPVALSPPPSRHSSRNSLLGASWHAVLVQGLFASQVAEVQLMEAHTVKFPPQAALQFRVGRAAR